MRKYWVIFKNSIQTATAYRFNVFASLFNELLTLLILAYLWISIYHQGNKIGNYSLKGLIIYFVVNKFINLIIKSLDTARIVGEEIREGVIINYLLKPINYLNEYIFFNAGYIFYRLIFYIFIFIIVIFFSLGFFDFNLLRIFYSIIFLVISYFINLFIFYIIGISTFYFGFIMGLNYLTQSIISFLSGAFLPIDLFPSWLYNLMNILPLKYIIYVPISILTGKLNFSISLLSGGILWMLFFYELSIFIFKKGIKKYEAFGI